MKRHIHILYSIQPKYIIHIQTHRKKEQNKHTHKTICVCKLIHNTYTNRNQQIINRTPNIKLYTNIFVCMFANPYAYILMEI